MTLKTVRRSGRLSKRIPILLIGSDAEGRVFSEEASTVVLSLHGAGILFPRKLHSEQELILRSLETDREVAVRVIGDIGKQERLFAYGVTFLENHPDFWGVEFPPAASEGPKSEPLHLECSLCHSPLQLDNGDFEFDVCAVHGGLVRFCEKCDFATVWKVASRPPPPRPAPSLDRANPTLAFPTYPSGLEPSSSQPKTRSKLLTLDLPSEPTTLAEINRRLHRRARVNYFACVRTETFGDDIVGCIDMSRGGVGFKTKNPYLLDCAVQIAVPFSREFPTAPAIFVEAKIVSRAILPDGQFFRCGLSFRRFDEENPPYG